MIKKKLKFSSNSEKGEMKKMLDSFIYYQNMTVDESEISSYLLNSRDQLDKAIQIINSHY